MQYWVHNRIQFANDTVHNPEGKLNEMRYEEYNAEEHKQYITRLEVLD